MASDGGYKASIERVNIAGRTLNAESDYASTTVTVRNTGTVQWTRKDDIMVCLAFGPSRTRILKGFFWIEDLTRELEPREAFHLRFNEFRTPPGTRRWELTAWVTKGPKGPLLDEWHGRLATRADYKVKESGRIKPVFQSLEKAYLKVGFKNVGDDTLPGGEKWRIRTIVKRAPRDADDEDMTVFEFLEPVPDWGRRAIPPNYKTGFALLFTDDVVPQHRGEWFLEATLMRGNRPFEPCAGTPTLLRFKTTGPDLRKHINLKIVDCPIWGKTLPAEKEVPDFEVKVLNRDDTLTWHPDDHSLRCEVWIPGPWPRARHHGWAELEKEIPPGATGTFKIRDLMLPVGNRQWSLHVGLWQGKRQLLVEKKRIETIAKLEGAWKVSGRRSLEPGQQTRFDVTIVNRGRNTWPAGYEDWSIEGIADVPGALTDESDQTYLAFSFRSRPLGRRDIGPGERLYWTHDVDPVPQYDGAFNMDFVLYKGHQPYELTREAGRPVRFDIDRAVPSAFLQLRSPSGTMKFGERKDMEVHVTNMGQKTFKAKQWRIDLEVEGTGSHSGRLQDEEYLSVVVDKTLEPKENLVVKLRVELDEDLAEEVDNHGYYTFQAHLFLIEGREDEIASSREIRLDVQPA